MKPENTERVHEVLGQIIALRKAIKAAESRSRVLKLVSVSKSDEDDVVDLGVMESMLAEMAELCISTNEGLLISLGVSIGEPIRQDSDFLPPNARPCLPNTIEDDWTAT